MTKKITLLLTFAVTCFFSNAQTWRLDYQFQYDLINGQYEFSDSIDCIYPDPQSTNLTEFTGYTWNIVQQALFRNWQQVYTYNQQGKRLDHIFYDWDGTQWVGNFKSSYTYDGFGNIAQSSNYSWFANAWFERSRSEYTYNANGFETSSTWSDTVNGILQFNNRYTQSYDASNRLIQRIRQVYENNTWVNNENRQHYFTGTAPVADSTTVRYWSTANNAWRNPSYRTHYYYTLGNRMTESVTQYDPGSGMRNSDRVTYTYNSDGNPTQESEYIWDVIDTSWLMRQQRNYTYNSIDSLEQMIYMRPDNNQTLQLYQKQTTLYNADRLKLEYKVENFNAGVLSNSWKANYFYEQVQDPSSISTVSQNSFAMVAYPNPFCTNTIVEFNMPVQGEAAISITDLTGKVVFEKEMYVAKGKNSFLWNAGEDVAAGTYFLQIINGSEKSFTRLIKN